MLWTIAVARLVFGPEMNIQAPPNLQPGRARQADRRGHQRLGRRVAGHARSRQSGSAVARTSTRWRARPARPARCWPSAWPSIRPMREPPRRVARRPLAHPVVRAHRRRRLRARRTTGRPGSARCRRRTVLAARSARSTPALQAILDRASAGERPERSGDRPPVRGARRASSPRSAPPPTGCAARSTATRSPTSSTATSTTPTSAISAASSAPSPRAS